MAFRKHILFIFLNLISLSFLGEVATHWDGDTLLTAAEACEEAEREDESESLLDCHVLQTTEKGGAGGTGHFAYFSAFQSAADFLTDAHHALRHEVWHQYTNNLLNSLYLPKLYRLFCCSKASLA